MFQVSGVRARAAGRRTGPFGETKVSGWDRAGHQGPGRDINHTFRFLTQREVSRHTPSLCDVPAPQQGATPGVYLLF